MMPITGHSAKFPHKWVSLGLLKVGGIGIHHPMGLPRPFGSTNFQTMLTPNLLPEFLWVD